jgi:hypothetical protein
MSNQSTSEQYRIVAFEQRFIPEPNSGCWIWTGMRHHGSQYGVFCFRRKSVRAHRAAWEIYRGAIPSGMCILHKCDVPMCVNPDHLFVGTQADNNADRDAKGRTKSAKGSTQHLAKLKESDIPRIRERRLLGLSLSTIAKEFGVSKHAIHGVVAGRTWTHV